jgi:riboflavin kinase/FMN adenylyltransferase
MQQVKNFSEINQIGVCINITIGNFDGVHLGHQNLIKQIKNLSSERLLVISFVKHTKESFSGNLEDFKLGDSQKKIELLNKYGIDYYLELDFETIKNDDALSFITNLSNQLPGLNAVYLGHDFILGRDRITDLNYFSKNFPSVSFVQLKKFSINGDDVSSTQIRNLLKNGDVKQANVLLGHEYSIKGEVFQGLRIGRTLGIPTANLKYANSYLVPKVGVYKGRVLIADVYYKVAINIGYNPTVNKANTEIKIEAHIIDFEGDLYGSILEIIFIDRIRDEIKFSDLSDLKMQITQDIELARHD